jgi:adenylate cyclase
MDFERRLEQEILGSERLRLTLMMVILGIAVTVFGVLISVFSEVYDTLFRGISRLQILATLGGLLGFEGAARFGLEQLVGLRRHTGYQGGLPRWWRYLTAFVETSIPTALILILQGSSGFHPAYTIMLTPIFLYFLFIILTTLHLDFRLSTFAGLVAATQYLAVANYLTGLPGADRLEPVLRSMPHHFLKALILLIAGILSGLVGRRLRRQFVSTHESIEERNRVVRMFGQYVSPAVVERLLRQTELGSENRHVCVMFFDIRDFTSFSERTTPGEVVRYLNALFEAMVDIVNRHNGIVNKFLGDGFMAVFGAPLSDGQDSRNAVRAALEMIRRAEELVKAGVIPKTKIGIGLHAGSAVTGNVGSATRKEYTVVGDVVNLASRIEQLNKQFDSQVLASEAVWTSVSAGGGVGCQACPLGPITVKGRDAPVEVFRLL